MNKRDKRFRKEILKALRSGSKTTLQLYKIIKKKCPEHCDDSKVCTHYVVSRIRQPEWKHKLRMVQGSMQKEFLIYCNKGSGKWEIVE